MKTVASSLRIIRGEFEAGRCDRRDTAVVEALLSAMADELDTREWRAEIPDTPRLWGRLRDGQLSGIRVAEGIALAIIVEPGDLFLALPEPAAEYVIGVV